MADISKIKLPSGSTYDIVDKKSGYKVVSINRKVDSGVNIADITIGDTTTQLYAPQGGGAGTITKVKTTAGAHTAIDVSSGAANFNVPTKTSHLTNDSGFVTTDTKNTAGSTNSSNKIYLIGAESQAANPQTYSNSNLYYNNGFYSREHTNHSDSYIEQTAGKVMISGVDTEYSMQSTVDVHTNYISLLCEMDDAQLGQAEFEFKVNTSDALMSIETTETLYTDIVALGWNSDVIMT